MKTKKMTWLALLALILTLAFPSAALSGKAAGTTYRVTVSSGYLALRNDTAYDASNEIGKLYTGDTVELCGRVLALLQALPLLQSLLGSFAAYLQ